MRKCRNWQTSKTKDLVSIALVWVQVPSSAFFICEELWEVTVLFLYHKIKSKCKKATSQNQKINGLVCDAAFLLTDIVYFTLTEEVLLQVE